ncbi:tetracycline resistance MFS efflux pump, partial [Acinetobacter baumannii]|nr:tetracycline resistance MFS efflux pump [Acinetobacter baumannii]
GLNLLFAYFVLPESRKVTLENKQLSTLNPFKIFAGISSIRGVLPLVTA